MPDALLDAPSSDLPDALSEALSDAPADTASEAQQAAKAAQTLVDVLIVGAGPAGCAAAITANRAGLDVLVVDKAEFPRDKTCGDGLTTMALGELARLGVSVGECSSAARPSHATLRSPSGRMARLPLQKKATSEAAEPAGSVAIATRSEFDFALTQAMRSAGITLLEGVGVDEISLTDNSCSDHGCVVRLNGSASSHAQIDYARYGSAGHDYASHIRARHVIAADGVYSNVRRSLGLGPVNYLGEWHAARQYRRVRPQNNQTTNSQAAGCRTATGSASDKISGSEQDLWVWFEPDILPGYVWSFPLSDGIVNFGFCALRAPKTERKKTGHDMAEIWRSLTTRPHIAEVLGHTEPCGPQRAWPIPARGIGEMPLAHGPVLFCGDAAALADPLTGEGIGQALLTGRLAAEAIATGADYERSVKQAIGADNRLSRLLSSALSRPAVANLVVRLVGTNEWSQRNFGRWLFEVYPRALLATPRRWRPSQTG